MKKSISLVLLLCLSSCCSVGVHYSAVISYEKSVGAEYINYVKNDGNLSEDQKKARFDAVEQFRAYLKAWRESQ